MRSTTSMTIKTYTININEINVVDDVAINHININWHQWQDIEITDINANRSSMWIDTRSDHLCVHNTTNTFVNHINRRCTHTHHALLRIECDVDWHWFTHLRHATTSTTSILSWASCTITVLMIVVALIIVDAHALALDNTVCNAMCQCTSTCVRTNSTSTRIHWQRIEW